jgi:Tfp pilus assembly protein PilO
MMAELQALRADVSELQERVDFTERLLARKAEPAQLAGPQESE